MEQIRAKTEDGSLYIFTTDSETEKNEIWGECVHVQNDGVLRAFGASALLRDTLITGRGIEFVVAPKIDETGRYVTTNIVAVDRQEVDETELPVIAALRELGLRERGNDGPDVVEKFVDQSLASIRSLRKTHTESADS